MTTVHDLADPVEDLETLPKLDVAPLGLPDFRGRKQRFIVDAALSAFGALLWAYVVAGELVVGVRLPEPAAVLSVLVAFGGTWYAAVVPAWRAGASWPRLVAPVVLAVAAFVVTVLFACSVSGHSNDEVQAISMALWFVAVFAVFVGRERARRRAAPAPVSSEQRAARFALWLVVGLVTLSALIVGVSRL